MINNPTTKNLLIALITILTIFMVILVPIRFMMTPAFISLEYAMPWFPEDPFGFTTEERLRYGAPTLKYMTQGESLNAIADLTMDDGTPVYNERELKHMDDVQKITQVVLWILYGSAMLLVAIWSWLFRFDRLEIFRRGLSNAGMITSGFMLLVLAGVALSFDTIFTWFHKIFFEDGTWMFLTSDSLIRMYPTRFWMDIFIYIGAFVILVGGAMWLRFRKK